MTIDGERAKQQFVAGYRVHIGANVADDVFAVGREVTIEGARAYSLYTAGDTIVVKNSTLRDLFAGGHGIEIDRPDLAPFTGRPTVRRGSSLRFDAWLPRRAWSSIAFSKAWQLMWPASE